MMRNVTTENGGQAMHAHDIEDMTILETRATFDESVNFSSRIQGADRKDFFGIVASDDVTDPHISGRLYAGAFDRTMIAADDCMDPHIP